MARVFQLDTDEHQAVQALLPWHVNGTLKDEELALVQSHLAQCARCQADADWLHALRASQPATQTAAQADVDRQWAALSQRLRAARPRPERWSPALAGWLRARWMPLALGLQSVTLVAALTLAWWVAAPRDEMFHALGAPPNAPANVLVVFRPTASEADIRAALRANRAQLVGGPTATDGYLLYLSPLSTQALSRLRADRAVLRVESLESDPR